MSHKEHAKKVKNLDLNLNPMVKTSSSATLEESPMRDFQKSSIRDLYKKEMDIIVEGFGNI